MSENQECAFPYQRSGQCVPTGIEGLDCESRLKNQRSRAQPFRYATGWLQFARQPLTFDLLRAAGVINLWTVGVTAPGAPAGIPKILTLAETDAGDNGAIADDGMRWITEGISISLGEPLSFQNAEQVYPSWIEGGLYRERLLRGVLETTSILLLHGTSGSECELRIGRLHDWPAPQHAGAIELQSSGMAGRFTYFFRRDVTLGGGITTARLAVRLTTETPVRIPNNVVDAVLTDVFIPVHVSIWGWPECCADVCSPEGAAKMMELEAKIARLEAMSKV